jgi:hypothetical protein
MVLKGRTFNYVTMNQAKNALTEFQIMHFTKYFDGGAVTELTAESPKETTFQRTALIRK